MQARQAELNAEGWGVADVPELGVGIGVNTGTVIAGTVGGGGRLEYTVVGDAVNVARGCSPRPRAARSSRRPAPSPPRRASPASPIGPRQVKGREEPVEVFRVPSTSAEPTASPDRARWPWLLVVVFVVLATLGMVLVVANGEPVVGQVSYLVAFAMFAVVGALIVSRDRRNVIGILLLWCAVVTGLAFASGELITWLVARWPHGADRRGRWGSSTASAGCSAILPVVFFLPLLFPDGRLPSPRWRIYVWCVLAFLALILVTLVFGQETLTGSGDAGDREPVLRVGGRRPAPARPVDRRRVPGPVRVDAVLALPAVPPFARGRAPADQVGGVRVPERRSSLSIISMPDHRPGVERVHRRDWRSWRSRSRSGSPCCGSTSTTWTSS